MVTGPFEMVAVAGTGPVPFYLLRFGADGSLRSPRAAEHLTGAAAEASDVFLFSHGWNNTFDVAAARYRGFVDDYVAVRAEQGLPIPAGYAPVMVGVVWPSTSIVFPWEDGPQIAAGPSADREELQRFVSASLPAEDRAEFDELVDGATKLAEADARRLVEIVHRALVDDDDEAAADAPAVVDVLDAWARLDSGAGPAVERPRGPDDFGTVDDGPAGGGSPDVAGWLSRLDPRNLLRMGTVWKMKRRAGVIGARGVGPVLHDVLRAGDARVHLVGHSFGAKVVLSAVATQSPGQRPVHGMLLLQAAVNRWCFADDAAGTGRAGGYRNVVGRVRRPILSTRSSHDFPLTKVFQVVMRGGHVGEPAIAAIGNEARYGALGGFGAAGLGRRGAEQDLLAPGTAYRFEDRARVVTLVGDDEIPSHGGVTSPATAWALHALTAQEG